MKLQQWQLKQRQSLPLEAKIVLSQSRIREWYEAHDGMVYVAFSGGRDSTVLLDLVRGMYPHVPAVFNDTGLEYPEIRDFVKTFDNVTWLKPKKNFKRVIEEYGYPVISKEQAQYIYELRTTKSDYLRNKRIYGNKWDMDRVSMKWLYLREAPFKISDRCCIWLKKNPVKRYAKDSGRVGIIGVRATEGSRRSINYLKTGCNNYNAKTPTSQPLAFWTHSDILEYINTRNLPYSSIYDMGYSRTGCMFCMFGVNQESEPNRFQQMAITHPKLYDYCINDLGCGKVLDYINVDYRPVLTLDLEVA